MKDGAVFTIVNARIPCSDIMNVLVFLDAQAKANQYDGLLYFTHDSDPILPYDRKIDIARKFLGRFEVQIVSSPALIIYEVLNDIWGKGYKKTAGIFGDNYFDEASKALAYNSQKLSNPKLNNDLFYAFDDLQILKDYGADEQTAETAKLLALAEDGDEGTFIDCCSLDEADAHEVFVLIRQSKGLSTLPVATRPEDRAISQLIKQRSTMIIPQRSTKPLGLQGQMAGADLDYTMQTEQIEQWLNQQVNNPFVGGNTL